MHPDACSILGIDLLQRIAQDASKPSVWTKIGVAQVLCLSRIVQTNPLCKNRLTDSHHADWCLCVGGGGQVKEVVYQGGLLLFQDSRWKV